jgi:hypothetical protein
MKKTITTLCIMLSLTYWSSAQNGLNFDGSNDIVQTNYTGVLGSADRTFEAWVFVSSSAPALNLAILDYGLNAVGSRNTFIISGSRGLSFISGGTNANIGTGGGTVPTNQWVHVAFVMDNSTGYLYINGVQMMTGSLTTVNTPTNNANVRIGQRVSGGTIPFNGTLDEVRIWDVARTAYEIQASMNSEICQHPNLQLHYKLNEGAAGGTNTGTTTTADYSGNSYNGTLSNFSLTGATSNWINGAAITNGSSTGSVQQTACSSFTWSANGMVYTTSGVYTEVLTGANAQGCDSTVTLNLTIAGSTSGTDTQTACDSYTWLDGNVYMTNNNTATHTIMNAAGCDSVLTLDLTITSSSSGTDTQTACGSYTWLDGNTYSASNNTATFTLTNAAGCDSVLTLDLTINTIDSSVTQNGTSLTSNATGATYQWLECPANTPISGATSQSYTATVNGSYAVIITDNNGCSDTSSCYNVSTVGTIENEFGNDLLLFPNPTDGQFAIDMGEIYNRTTVTITDLTGKLILSNTYSNSQLLNLKLNEPSGVYLLVIEAENKRAVIRLVKK